MTARRGQIILVVGLWAAAVGFGPARAAEGKRAGGDRAPQVVADRPRTLYLATANRSIWWLTAPPGRGGRVLVVEHGKAFWDEKAGMCSTTWLVKLEAPHVRTSILGGSAASLMSAYAYAADDAVARTEDGCEVQVLPPGKGWVVAIPKDHYLRMGLAWSPDSTRLLYPRYAPTKEHLGIGTVVVATVGADGRAREEEMMRDFVDGSITWSSDGRAIYVANTVSEREFELSEIEYPSAKRRVIQTAPWVNWAFSVPGSGELLWFASQDGRFPLHLWRRNPGGPPREANVVLQRTPDRVWYAPDGKAAVATWQEASETTVIDLVSGRERAITIPEGMQAWAFDGKGLICCDRKRVMYVPVPGAEVAPRTGLPHSALPKAAPVGP